MVVSDYHPVGAGRGNYALEVVSTPTSHRPSVCLVGCFGVVSAMFFILALVWWKAGGALPAWHPGLDVSSPCEDYRSSIPLIQAVVNSAWRCLHADHAGRVSVTGLTSCQELAPDVLQDCSRVTVMVMDG